MPESKGLNPLNEMPRDGLIFRMEQRRLELSDLEERLARTKYKEGSNNDEFEQLLEAEMRGSTSRRHDASGYKTEGRLSNDRRRMESRMKELRKELTAIEVALRSKSE